MTRISGTSTKGVLVTVGFMVLFAAGWIAMNELIPGGDENAGDPWTFEETLPLMVEDFGADTKVLSIDVGSSVTYAVLPRPDSVHVRRYYVEIGPGAEPGAGSVGRTRKVEDSQRELSPGEARRASVALGALDPDVLSTLREQLELPERFMAQLRGDRWLLWAASGEAYEARHDGTRVRPAELR